MELLDILQHILGTAADVFAGFDVTGKVQENPSRGIVAGLLGLLAGKDWLSTTSGGIAPDHVLYGRDSAANAQQQK